MAKLQNNIKKKKDATLIHIGGKVENNIKKKECPVWAPKLKYHISVSIFGEKTNCNIIKI